MVGYIRRYDAMKICEQYSQHCFDTNDAKGQDVADRIEWDIIDLSTADVAEVKHGEWIYHEMVASHDGLLSGYSCSECSGFVDEEVFDSDEFHKSFCGCCGAKMDKKEGVINDN